MNNYLSLRFNGTIGKLLTKIFHPPFWITSFGFLASLKVQLNSVIFQLIPVIVVAERNRLFVMPPKKAKTRALNKFNVKRTLLLLVNIAENLKTLTRSFKKLKESRILEIEFESVMLNSLRINVCTTKTKVVRTDDIIGLQKTVAKLLKSNGIT